MYSPKSIRKNDMSFSSDPSKEREKSVVLDFKR